MPLSPPPVPSVFTPNLDTLGTTVEALVDGIPHMLWLADDTGIPSYYNRWTLSALGPVDPQHEHWLHVVHPDDRDAAAERWSAALVHGRDYVTELRLRVADGSYRWHLIRAFPLRETAGAIRKWLGTCTDIHEQKVAEAERDRLIAAMRMHFARLPLAYMRMDADMRVMDWNEAATRTFGYTRDEMLAAANPLELVVAPDALPEVEACMERLRTGDASEDRTNQNVTKDGRVITCEWHNTPLFRPDGSFDGMIALAQDITARVESEQALRDSEERLLHAQKMEAIGRLAGGIAHDFNNHLTVINGCSELLADYVDDPAAARQLAQEINEAGRRCATLTQQLLTFSRKHVLAPRAVDVNDAIRDTERMLRRLIGEDVILETRLAPDATTIHADPAQLSQVLINLAVNARDAMPRGGTLTLETRTFARMPGDDRDSPCIALSVADTGIGMTAEVQQHAFEPFFTTKGPTVGTGLGLAVVHGVVEQSHGRIAVTSAPGNGTTVTIYFPRHDAAPDRPAAPALPQALPQGHETVLLVEDDDHVRSLATSVLQHAGYVVMQAGLASDALQLAAVANRRIDLLVTDVVMPGIQGPELAAQLEAAHPDVQVLYVSGYTDDTVLRHGIEQEHVHFLPKPYQPVDLAQKVRQVLDSVPRP